MVDITITGASGSIVTLQGGTGRLVDPAVTLQTQINDDIAAGTVTAYDLENNSGSADVSMAGIATQAGTYQIGSGYKYIVVSDSSDSSAANIVNLQSDGNVDDTISILAGRLSGIGYQSGNESGTLLNTAGTLAFDGASKTGNWTIYTGAGNNSIITTNGSNDINTGVGSTGTIVLGTGPNRVYSQGSDTITGGSGGYQTIFLTGSKASIDIGHDALINDGGSGNDIIVGKNSTVTGGTSGNVTMKGGDQTTFQSGSNDTVSVTDGATVRVVHGVGNKFEVDGDITYLNGTGVSSIHTTGTGLVSAFGLANLNLTLGATGSQSGLFVANTGNETLDGSTSTAVLQIYANTVSGGVSSFVATGGSGDDLMSAGTGSSTFTGGDGNNLFFFAKASDDGGQTVITDFSHSAGNKIALYDYGLDTSSLQALLANSQNDADNNAVLNLDNHKITLQGVELSSLHTDQFALYNAPTKTA